MVKAWFVLILIVSVLPITLKGQIRPVMGKGSPIEERPRQGMGMDENQIQNRNENQNEKELVDVHVKIWKLTGDGSFLKKNKLDTLQKKYQIFNPIYKNSITNTFTGNFGGAYEDNNFFKRKYATDFYFLQTHDAYILTPERIDFYNTTTPYTILDYSQSEKQNSQNETRFNVLHSQNVNENLNFTFRYDQAKSDGQYNYQFNKNSFVTLYSSYTSDKLNIHGGFISNLVRNQENGGMVDDADLLREKDQTRIIFNLVDAKSEYMNNFIFATTEYKLGKYFTEKLMDENGEEFEKETFKPFIGLLYKLEVQNNSKTFQEESLNPDYFENIFLDSISTYDLVRFNKITNLFHIKQYENADKKTSFGKRAFLGFNFVKTVIPRVGDSIFTSNTYNNIYIGGGIFREQGKFWKWNFEGKLYTVGYKSGQTELNGIISKPISILHDSLATIEISGSLENLVPDYFQQKYISNHQRWFNEGFNDVQRMTAEFKLALPKFNLEAGVNYALLNNYIYNNEIGVPSQTKEELLILGAYLNKDISLKKLNIDSKLLVQSASNERYVHLPDFSALVSVYYSFIWSKVLFTQIGADIRYNTAYYADAYDPSTSLFYLQNEKEIGNYPYIDVYASFKLKRTRVFFKWINVGSEFLDGEYFTALYHPMNRRTFRLGVAWTFYD